MWEPPGQHPLCTLPAAGGGGGGLTPSLKCGLVLTDLIYQAACDPLHPALQSQRRKPQLPWTRSVQLASVLETGCSLVPRPKDSPCRAWSLGKTRPACPLPQPAEGCCSSDRVGTLPKAKRPRWTCPDTELRPMPTDSCRALRQSADTLALFRTTTPNHRLLSCSQQALLSRQH